ncbi:MAG: hypothetical protein JWL68_5373, partial [Actinomycetia bacterium]|nr:hypothetical protein [Actinomycetes bacterium]
MGDALNAGGTSMSVRRVAMCEVTAAAPAAGGTRPAAAWPAGDVPADAVPLRAADHGEARARAGWWQAWRSRFGLAELCGTIAAAAGFAAGYLAAGSLLAAAGLATLCEAIGFYGCVGVKTAIAACQATTHLAGWRRLAAGTWHAVTEHLASCAAAEALDGFLIRPGCLVGAAWLLRPLPAGVWLGFAVGKAIADVAWYGVEASARRGVTWSAAA